MWSSSSRSAESWDALLRRFVEASRRGEIVARVNAADSGGELGALLTTELCKAYDAEIGFVFVRRATRARPSLLASVGLTREQAAHIPDDPLCLTAFAEGRTLVHQGVDLLHVGARSLALVPAVPGGGVPVVVGVACLDSRPFDDAELALLETIANRAGEALERLSLERRLREAQRLEALGRLAGGIAHDFNNLLTAIIGYSELVRSRLQKAGLGGWSEVDEVRRAADMAASLTAQLLTFAREQARTPVPLDVNQLIARLEDMLRTLIGERIELELHLDPEVGGVRADPSQVEQVVVNLALNARDAMPDGGRLTIETANHERQHAELGSHDPMPAGRYVVLGVRDTGVGMDASTEAQIFEPFFTTKERGKGTGLGLATVYGIVKQNSGQIAVHSIPGDGTAFEVYLPRVEVDSALETADALPAPASDGTETILLVEDADAVRGLVRQVLERKGYTVLEARDGEHALEVSAEHEQPIALLLADVVMPKMGGHDLARRLRSLRPETRVLYMSGYTGGALGDGGELPEGTALLTKPFDADALARRVREVLGEPASR
jgi:signal transduction histidine kinase